MSTLTFEEVTDPEELKRARAQRQHFDRNAAWFQRHTAELFERYHGQCVCIAGEEAFAADTPQQALALATQAHPDDDGRFVDYIPRERLMRISAHRRRVAPLR